MAALRDYHIHFKPFADLTQAERDILKTLTLGTPTSEFLVWLDDEDGSGKYAAIAVHDGEVVGWAAANLRYSCAATAGMIGVYVDLSSQRRGIARRALDTLCSNLARLSPLELPLFFYYEQDKERLFGPALEQYGLRKAPLYR